MLFLRKIGVRLIIVYFLQDYFTHYKREEGRILPLALTAIYLLTLCEGNAERISGKRITSRQNGNEKVRGQNYSSYESEWLAKVNEHHFVLQAVA